jgi:hypothetical protein
VTAPNTPDGAQATLFKSKRGRDGVISMPQTLSSVLSAASDNLRVRRVAVSVDAGRVQIFKRLVERHLPRVVVTEDGNNTAAARQLIKKPDELCNKSSFSKQMDGEIGPAAGTTNVDAAIAQALKDFNVQSAKPHAETK